MFLHAASLSKFEAIFDSDMRALFVILGLLLCLTGTRADELLVINDSEAAQYVGGNVEVRGLVVSVTTSSLGTAFINFGREYPDQTFAGFIAAGSKMADDPRLTTLQGKTIDIIGTKDTGVSNKRKLLLDGFSNNTICDGRSQGAFS